MDITNIKDIMELMKENDLCEFEIEEEGLRIAMKRRFGAEPQMMMAAPAPMMMSPSPVAGQPAAPAPAPKSEDEGLTPIPSPIVGTFYRASSPDAAPFISVGDRVTKDSVVCIIEAMKVMNEIKSEVSGVVKKIMVENATPVQFGQPLFLVDPS